nr:twin-arginine translocation signal domain-containing protein [Chloroflexota bacterium]
MTGKLQTPNFQLQTSTQPASCGITRRDFLKLSAVAGGAAFLGALPHVQKVFAKSENGGAYDLAKITNQINTVCLQCNTVCGIKVKLLDGVAAKIDGSPYSPWTLSPHLKYDTPLAETGNVEGAICPKGQAGLQTVYDPYRIVKALKRKPGTQRGQNQWVTVEFDQALQEIVDGGDLFGEGPVPGLKDSFVLTDSKVAKAMADEVKKILAEKDAEKKAGLLAEFKKTFAAD